VEGDDVPSGSGHAGGSAKGGDEQRELERRFIEQELQRVAEQKRLVDEEQQQRLADQQHLAQQERLAELERQQQVTSHYSCIFYFR